MPGSFRPHHVLLTGAAGAIGGALARVLAARHPQLRLSLVDCNAAGLLPLRRELGARSRAAPCDLADTAALPALWEEACREFGRIDTLVCNAASNPYYGPQAGISDEQFRKILDNNVLSNHWLIQMCLPQMLQRQSGSIIIVSSIGGLRGSTSIGAYCISKAADMQLARNLAHEYGPQGVRVNCIAPGSIEFPGGVWEQRNQAGDPLYARTLKGIPMGRMGTPEEIAEVALFLASPHARWITGQTITVDGGQLLGA